MDLGDLGGEAEAEADAAAARRVRAIAAGERLQHALALALRHARPRVGDRELEPVVLLLGGERDRRTAVLGRVLDQVEERAAQERPIALDRELGGRRRA